jgi:hypothetical protein
VKLALALLLCATALLLPHSTEAAITVQGATGAVAIPTFRTLSRARFGLLAYMSRGMLSPTLHRPAIPNPGALTLSCNSSALIVFADWKRLVFRVDTLATTTFSIVDGARHDPIPSDGKQEDIGT